MKICRTTLNGTSVDGNRITFIDYLLEEGENIEEFMLTMREMLGGTSDWTFIKGGARVIEKHRDPTLTESPSKKRKGG